MRTVALILLTVLALAGQGQTPQTPSPAPTPAAQQAPSPAATPAESPDQAETRRLPSLAPEPAAPFPPEKTPEQVAAEAAAVPTDLPFHGFIDFGWRFRPGIGGDVNTYKSVVDIDKGATLLGADLTYDPTSDVKWIDRLRVVATSWGAYPYSSLRLDAEKSGSYRFLFDFRDLNLFSFLPTFANPFFESGIFATQYGWDMDIRSYNAELEFLPRRRVSPYIAWTRGTDDGDGVRNFVLSRNEYTLPFRVKARADNFRGGVRFGLNERASFTLEGGFVNYREDENLFFGPTTPSPFFGNITTPVFGGRLFLTNAYEAMGVRGDDPFARGLLTANPVSWMTITGGFLFSQPESDISFVRTDTGSVVADTTLASAELLLTNSRAIQPHPSGRISIEVRPRSRFRVIESFSTDRLHVAGSGLESDAFFRAGATIGPEESLLAGRLVVNYNRNDLNGIVDVLPSLSLRGGWRHVFGDVETPPSIPAAALGIIAQGADLRQDVGLAGVTWRPVERFRATADFEGATSDFTYFRTSLHDYQRFRSFLRYQLTQSLQLGARFNILNNNRPRPNYPAPVPVLDFDYQSRDATLTLAWVPQSYRYSIIAEYARQTIESDTDYVNPATLQSIFSPFDERAHTGVLLVDVPLMKSSERSPRLNFGGSFYRTSGSRPVTYYLPEAKFWVPVVKWAEFHVDWQWYSFHQPMFSIEGFRAHTLVTALRLKL